MVCVPCEVSMHLPDRFLSTKLTDIRFAERLADMRVQRLQTRCLTCVLARLCCRPEAPRTTANHYDRPDPANAVTRNRQTDRRSKATTPDAKARPKVRLANAAPKLQARLSSDPLISPESLSCGHRLLKHRFSPGGPALKRPRSPSPSDWAASSGAWATLAVLDAWFYQYSPERHLPRPPVPSTPVPLSSLIARTFGVFCETQDSIPQSRAT